MLCQSMVAVFGFLIAGVPPLLAAEPVGEEILSALRIVEDPEGTANVRSGQSVQAKVLDQLRSGTVVAVEPGPVQDWVKLDTETDDGQVRYIHSSRLRPLGKWKQVMGRVKTDDSGVVGAEGFEVRVKGVPFKAADHRIAKDKDGLALVDGKSPWGVDGGLPAVTLTWMVSFNGQPLPVPAKSVENLYQPNPETLVLLTPTRASDQAVVLMVNSDGAGAYCVAWSFKGGQYCGRAVFVPF